MNIPTAFEDKLREAFQGRLRIRWSEKEREYRIEQRVGRAVTAPIRIEADRDDLICARDGYDYVLSVRSGDRMPCPDCQWTELKVPIREFADIRCPYCASKKRQGRVVAGYFPLDDSLIQHLRMLDPEYEHSRHLATGVDERNARRLASMERETSNTIWAHGDEHYDELVGIPHFGYSDSKMWPKDLGPEKANLNNAAQI